MTLPLIGITCSLEQARGDSGQQVVDLHYVDAVERAGGCPLLLPMTAKAETLQPLLERIDALLITGGPGITQGLVGELPADLPPTPVRRQQADAWAFSLAQERGRPVLGICYGMQFINARLGGTIYGDVQRQLGTGPHSPARNRGEKVEHEVVVESGTVLAGLAGAGQAAVNSYHLQAVERPGKGLKVSARSQDGLVEGLESEDGLLLGVQFHPERLPGTAWENLFEELVRRAGRR
jgi:putative glutamine amidotransferase